MVTARRLLAVGCYSRFLLLSLALPNHWAISVKAGKTLAWLCPCFCPPSPSPFARIHRALWRHFGKTGHEDPGDDPQIHFEPTFFEPKVIPETRTHAPGSPVDCAGEKDRHPDRFAPYKSRQLLRNEGQRTKKNTTKKQHPGTRAPTSNCLSPILSSL